MKLSAICVFVRNEAHSIQEWIAYHAVIGFDSVILYDNGSSDATVERANAMRPRVDVQVVDWSQATGHGAQTDCYMDCCRRFKGEFQWIAFLDSDEVLAAPRGKQIKDLVATKFFASAIAFNWACFGSSGHVDTPDGLMIAAFDHRSDESFDPNVHTKIMVRPEQVLEICNPHYFRMDGPMVRPNGQPVDWAAEGRTAQVCLTDWKINHYFIRSLQQWRVKVARGYRDPTVRSEDMFAVYDRNEVEDHSASERADEVASLISAATRPSFWQRVASLMGRR